MGLEPKLVSIGNILTRTTGYLQTVSSHSLQPYRGCTFGRSLCGVGCYVQHNGPLLRGQKWGTFLDVRTNAAESYRLHFAKESSWARRERGEFSIFCSSSTDPFLPQERRYGITRQLLQMMLDWPPDLLILQTHSPLVVEVLDLLLQLQRKCRVRVHISIESDRDQFPGLPPAAAKVSARLAACERLHRNGIRTLVTVAPLLPIADPAAFFQRIAAVADGVVIDHFVGGDGSPTGSRTWKTPLPAAMKAIDPHSVTIDYCQQMIAVAKESLPGRVGYGIDGFADRMITLPTMVEYRTLES